MITKFATVESIIEVKSSKSRLSFNYDATEGTTFAKFAALDDGIKEEDGYLYVRCRAISSRVNKNNDGWPSEELAKGYETFEGRPIFVDHNNKDPKRTRGVIVASELKTEDTDKQSKLDPYYATAPENHKPPTWIELLLEVDANTYPKLAADIRSGKIDSVSMGANIDTSICSVCAHEATVPSEYCKHIKQKGSTFEVTSDDGKKIKKKAYEDCYGLNFFEISFVFDPADPTADVLSKKGSINKFNEQEVRELAESAGTEFNEIAAYLESRGEYDGPRGSTRFEYLNDDLSLSEMVGKTLPMERVASLKKATPNPEDFMSPKGQEPATEKNRNHVPQADMVTAPEHVDTLRNDQRCPVCHAAEMETGADGIDSCPICGHVQEPEPLNNPDLEIAQNNNLRQDVAQPGAEVSPVTPAATDPLDNVIFDDAQVGQPTSKRSITTREYVRTMFTTKLKTTSKEEADKILPSKVAKIEAKLGRYGVHRGVYDAAREAGLKVKVAYPAVKSTEDNSVEVPGDNGIFNLFHAEESAINLKVPMEEVPVVIEAATAEDAEKFIKILAETPLPSRRAKGNDKQEILPNSKPSDEPKKEKVISDSPEPVESKLKEAVTIDGVVELDGIKYKLHEIKDEEPADESEGEPKEPAKDEPKAEDKPKEDSKDDADEPVEEDREAKLLAAFKLADMAVEMGLVLQENKMAFVAELEEETLEQISAREATLNAVKTAGLLKKSSSSPLQGVKRVPRLSHASPPSGSGSKTDDFPLEAIFL